MYLARTGAIQGFDNLLTELGGNPLTLIQASGLTAALFRSPNSYIAYSKMAELLQRCARVANEPLFGLMLAERHGLAALGELPVTISQEPTIAAAIEKFDQFLFLHATGASVRMRQSGEDAEVQVHISIHTELGINQQIMMSVADMANLLAVLLGIDRFDLTLYLRQAAPPKTQASRQGFYGRTRFNSHFDGLKLPVSLLNRRAKMDEAAIKAHFLTYQNALKTRYPGNLHSQIMEMIGHLLASGDYGVEKVAANLGMNPRVLQRKLQQQGCSYGKLLRETRLSIASQHLAYGVQSITDLALNLGYAETAVFSRQFKHWTGMSPSQWRAAHR